MTFCHESDDVDFPIVNFRFTCENIPATSAYIVGISRVIRYIRACKFISRFRGHKVATNTKATELKVPSG